MAVGDVVYLKSGSLPMTIIKEDEKDGVTVSWAVGSSLNSQILPMEAVTPNDPQPSIDHARDKVRAQLVVDDPLPKPIAEVVRVTPA